MPSLPKGFTDLPGHARLVCAVLLAGALLLFLLAASRAVTWYAEGSDRLAAVEPRYARLVGFSDSVDFLRASRQVAAAQLAEVTYPATADLTSTGPMVQQQLRRILESAGLSVSGSQVLSPEEHEGYLALRIDLDAAGPMDALEQVLLGLHTARPLIFIRSLELSPAPTRRRDNIQEVSVALSVSVVKLQ